MKLKHQAGLLGVDLRVRAVYNVLVGILLLNLSSTVLSTPAAIQLQDDGGQAHRFTHPPQRLISLAPHITELLFEIGAAHQVVGVSQYSDYPAAAKERAQVGDAHALDLEQIRQLNPDLIIAWKSGNRPRDLQTLKSLGFPIFYTEVGSIAALPALLLKLGSLTGHPQKAAALAKRVLKAWRTLIATYAHRTPVPVFYQVWQQPLMTVTRKQWIGDALAVCGAKNPFTELPGLSPTVSLEDVIAAAPEIIFSSSPKGRDDSSLNHWQKWTQLPAVRQQRLIYLNADEISRPTPRFLNAATALCREIDQARQALKRGA